MLSWAIFFFICAVVAAILGFGGVASAFAGVAKILAVVFAVLLLIALVSNALRGRAPRV